MKKKYAKPDVNSDLILEQTSLSCVMSQNLDLQTTCANYVKVEGLFADQQSCQSYLLDTQSCNVETTLLS